MAATDPHARRLFERAKQGDEDAQRQVALMAFNRYQGRIREFVALDPAQDVEDLLQTFFLAIYNNVTKDKGIGDSLYWLGQQGVYAVRSELRALKSLLNNRAWKVPVELRDPDDYSNYLMVDQIPDTGDGDSEYDIVHRDVDNQQTIKVIARAAVSPKQRELVQAALSMDPHIEGWNKALADNLGVSPQRASQVINEIREGIA